ncbi:hypothetical protein DL769_008959 [Monosporascus sp. CRB-8-3]|nr:hypothetical protein DL769_008959 [Monosporascus sp. CRB-8-3]
MPTGTPQHPGPEPQDHSNLAAESAFNGQGIHKSGRDLTVGRDLITVYGRSDKDVDLQTTTNKPENGAPDPSSSLTVEQRQQLRDSLRFDQIGARHMNIWIAHARTCEWLQKKDEYIDWLSPSKLLNHHGFLWVKGKPGTGKSTLMKFALAQARRSMKDWVILSFFFNAHGDELEKSTAGMYRSLLLQLLESIPGLDAIFDPLRLTVWPRDGQMQWSVESLKDLFGQAIQSLGRSQVVCFIDALDECDEDQIRDMLPYFEHMGELAITSNIRFQVCFSSRHYPHFITAHGLQLVLEDQEGHNQDIANYIDSKLRIGHSTAAEEIKAELQAKASNVFLWVVLVVDILNREYDSGRIHALPKRLREIPAGLHDLFRDILTRDTRDRDELILCIQWVLYAKRPLRPEEIYFAILAEKDPEFSAPWNRGLTTFAIIRRFIVDSSRGLAGITESKTPVVQFIHESVRDFLKYNGLRGIRPDLGDPFHGQGHEQLKECCLKYILNIAGTLHLLEPLPKASSKDAADLRSQTQQSNPFLEYAVRNVLYHGDQAESEGIDQSGFLRSFPLQSWININNLFERYEARRHSSGASLLYILAERNLAHLIKAHFATSSPLEASAERYGNPFFAALATGSTDAVQAFAELEVQSMNPSNQFKRLCQNCLGNPGQVPELGRYFCPSKDSNWLKLAKQGEVEFAQLLLAMGKVDVADVDAKDEDGRTPLLWAAGRGHEAIAKLLLDTGKVDPDAKDKNGWTPLFLAAANGYEAVVKLLLNTGMVDPDIKDKDNRTPLLWAARKGHKVIAKLLFDTDKVDPYAKDKDGRTPLLWAARKGHEVTVKLLLDTDKVDPDAKDKDGGTPLVLAAANGHETITKLLLDTGKVDPDLEPTRKYYAGRTPLSLAAQKGSEGIVKLLLDMGKVNGDSMDTDGRTPLSWAAENGHESTVKLLLDIARVDIDLKDKDGRTPLWYAVEKARDPIVRLISMQSQANPRIRLENLDVMKNVEFEREQNLRSNDHSPNIEAIQPATPTDSEYASATHDKYGHTQSSGDVQSRPPIDEVYASAMNNTFEVAYNEHDPESDDDETVYSDASGLPALAAEESYISELADDLFKTVCSEQFDGQIMERISGILPKLLKAFALKLGHNALSQMHRDVMFLVHKHRNDIVKDFKDMHSRGVTTPPEDQISVSDKMPLNEVMGLWDKNLEDTENDVIPDVIDEASVNDLMNQDSNEGDEKDNQEASTTQLRAYRDFIFNSPPYEWLLASLRKEILLAPAEPNSLEAIRREIIKSLPSSHVVSRKKPAEAYKMTFVVEWNPLAFVIDQGYEEEPDEAIGIAVTLTGSATDAQALTSAQYLRQTWPTVGEHIIRLVREVVRSGAGNRHRCDLPDNTNLAAWVDGSKFVVEVFGTRDSVAEIGEQLAWLGAALCSPLHEFGVAYSTPFISCIHVNKAPHPMPRMQSWAGFLCKIDFAVKGKEPFLPSNGQCWHNMFRNPVVVTGYPILRRSEPDTGLEIPLNIMVGLTRTQRANTFNGKLFIKGFSTMLIPTKRNGDLLVWHLLYNQDGNRISYLENTGPHAENVSIFDLETARHILGWCSEVKFFAGAADANYAIEPSRLPRTHEGCALEKVVLYGGQIATGGFPFSLGLKDTPVRISRGGYTLKLKWIHGKFVVLWDEEDKRGWLVNGSSALLHLLRASLEYDSIDEFNSEFRFKREDMQEAPETHKAYSAVKVLLNRENLKLEIYPEKEDYIRVKSRVEDLLDILEKIIDYQFLAASQSGVNSKFRARKYLEGWDFNDLAKPLDPIHPRVATLQTPGKGWVDFTRAIHAITLFGRGFGELIQPVDTVSCAHWAKLPKGEYYLAACVYDLQKIMDRNGNQEANPIELSDNIIWHNPDKIFEPCECTEETQQEHSDFVQVLLPSGFRGNLPKKDPVRLKDQAAVIFGHNMSFKWYWKDTGHPEEGISPSPSKQSEIQLHDSGIGSSLSSSATEARGDFADSSSQPSSERPSGETLTRKHYEVGVVCALPKELMAVLVLFDSKHEVPKTPPEDDNCYSLGRIGEHNVVATCLPEYGTNAAAAAVVHMVRSFPVRFCLLVGIGGGVPSEQHDIRLGDVVVSNTGVIQYDLVKLHQGGVPERTGCLPPPPPFLTKTISNLRSDPNISMEPLRKYVDDIAARKPEYKDPGPEHDELFEAEYVHDRNHDSCRQCNTHKIKRKPRPENHPIVHYGSIASGNQVMKDAQIRDKLGAQDKVLCFEMEAAGIMKIVPCLVIRGICDYADSHKNKLWQEYAAATAAAYAKFFLSFVRNSNDLESMPADSETVKSNHSRKRPAESLQLEVSSRPKKPRQE